MAPACVAFAPPASSSVLHAPKAAAGRRSQKLVSPSKADPCLLLRPRGGNEPELSLRHTTADARSLQSSARSYSSGVHRPLRSQAAVLCGLGISQPGQERDSSSSGAFQHSYTIPTTAMAKGLGSVGGVTLERSKLDTSRQVQTAQPKLDNSGGGGNIGKNIFNGGGGDGDDGDDDDYFDDFGEDGDGDGDGDGFFRAVIAQLYDKESIRAVMMEWFRSMESLPAVIRQSVMMGLFSSAQLVRFFAMDVRPNVTRAVTRTFPTSMSRGVVGRLMADPAFVQKFVIEELLTLSSSLWWEARQRGKNFTKELDLVAINTLCLMSATGAAVWLLAPSRSYGSLHKFPWQNMLHNLPNNVFDASGPQRQYTMTKRVAGAAAKMAELCAVGSIAGAAMSGLGSAAVAVRRRVDPSFQPSVAVPELGRSSSGFAASMGLFSNLRYQAIGGIDRYFFEHSVHLFQYLVVSAAARTLSKAATEPSRLWLQGLPGFDALSQLRQSPVARPAAAAGAGKAKAKKRVVKRVVRRRAGGPALAPA